MWETFEEKKIKNSFILIAIFLALISITFTAFLFNKYINSIHKKILKEYEKVYINKSKGEVKNVVDYFVDSIKFEMNHAIKDSEKTMENNLTTYVSALKQATKYTPLDTALKIIINPNKSIVVINEKGKIICGTFFKPISNIANDISTYGIFKTIYSKREKGKFLTTFLVDLYRNKQYNKYIIASIYVQKYKIFILQLKNISTIEKKIKSKFKVEINNFRYGISKKRYLFILRLEKTRKNKIKVIRIVNPNRPKSWMNKEIPINIKDIKGKEFLKEMVHIALTKGSGFVEYYFNIIGENKIAPKISYIRYYKPWNWIVGSGFYPNIYKSDLFKRDIHLAKLLKKYTINLVIELSIFTIILFSVFMVFINTIMKRIKKYRNTLEKKERFQKHLIESIPNPLFIIDRDGNFLEVNEAFEKFFCIKESEITKGSLKDKVIEEIKKQAMDFFNNKNTNQKELIVRACKTEKSYIEISNSIYTDKNGEPAGVIGIIFDITTKKEKEEELKQISIKDELTGLFNRRHFNEIINSEIQRSTRHKEPLSIIIYDIDHFKNVNDTYGHLIGDEILKELSKVVKSSLRSSDYIFRTGGEEFTILLPETNIKGAYKVAEKIRKKVESHNFKNVGKITISLGVAEYKRGETPEDFIKRADNALYKSKREGRNKTSKG